MRETAESISVFVVHWNRPLDCAATIGALLGQGHPLKVVIVDNASAADARETLRVRVESKAEIVLLAENKGWGPALNVVLRSWLESERDPFCLISAHDATPSGDCVELLVQAMQRDPRIGIACPQYENATVPHLSALHGVREVVDLPRARGTAQLIDVPHGTLMLLRRECLEQIGLFDERYFAYGDEHELGARAVRQGWKVALVWGALVANRGTWTPSAWRSYLFARNSLLLVHDYFGRMAAWLRAIVILANTLRLVVFPPENEFAFSAKARWHAVRDYFLGRYGPPRFE
jgi:N-acetylglucosaminyl-diphospho-decaprenol L-rhamnosyltransferase